MRDELLAGRYRTLDTIGVGGMAKVYLAQDERLGRRVAVKRLHSDSPEDAAERFEREAKLGASLNHPNLVSIFDIATDGESVLIVMEYVAGKTLKEELSSGPLPVEDVLDIMGDIAAALDHAHGHGVVHRDVKPANILLRRDGTAKLADLGIATAAEGTRITRSGMVLGTAAYMAPEQLDGRAAGRAADVYSLATVTFEALTGKKARTGNTPMEIAHRVINEPPPDLRESWPDAPEGAAEALQRAMSRHPGDRPRSAGKLMAALREEFARDARRGAPEGEGAAAAVPLEEPPADTDAREPPAETSPSEHPRRAEPSTAESKGRPPAPDPEPPARRPDVAAPAPRPAVADAESRSRSRGQSSRAPAFRSSRKLPSWAPAAAVLVAFCVIGAILLATTGGGGEETNRDDRADSAAERPRADAKKGGGTSAGGSEGGGGSGDAPASGGSAQTQSGGGSGQLGSGQSGGGSAATGNPAALNDQGYRLMRAGRYDEAIPLLQRAVNAYPKGSKELTYAYALYNLGRSLRLAGRPEEAIPILEQRLQIPNQLETVRSELEAARQAAG